MQILLVVHDVRIADAKILKWHSVKLSTAQLFSHYLQHIDVKCHHESLGVLFIHLLMYLFKMKDVFRRLLKGLPMYDREGR